MDDKLGLGLLRPSCLESDLSEAELSRIPSSRIVIIASIAIEK